MFINAHGRLAASLGLIFLLATPAGAQPRPDPLDAKAAVPAPRHRSALADYSARYPVEAVPWREANDTVTRIGGWRVYTREAHAAPPGGSGDRAAPQPPSAASPAGSAPQTGVAPPKPGHPGKH